MSNINQALARMSDAGVNIQAQGNKLIIESVEPLTDRQRSFFKGHKPEILALLAHTAPPPLSPEDRKAITEALSERAAIQEFDGGLTRTDAENQAREAMRVYRFRLRTDNGWCTLVAPGWSVEDAECELRSKYGNRLLEVREHRPLIKETQA